MRAPRGWRHSRPGLVARALGPLGALYGAATARRMARPGARVEAPVLCIGNFVAGGAGKTPTAIALARALRASGKRPAFLSRGYGGETRAESVRVSPSTDNARKVGDEPMLLARVAPCFVGPDRVASAKLAIEEGANVLVMDDGLQNPALEKTLSVVAVDGESPFGNGLCLPAGPLRAPVAAQMPFVDALVMIGGDDEAASFIAKRAPDRPLFRASLKADALAASQLTGRPVLAFAGIANPEKFFASLVNIGAHVAETEVFPDHWPFRMRDIDRLVARAARRGLILVCTEKDLVRVPREASSEVRTLPVTLRFETPDAIAAWLTGLWR